MGKPKARKRKFNAPCGRNSYKFKQQQRSRKLIIDGEKNLEKYNKCPPYKICRTFSLVDGQSTTRFTVKRITGKKN